MSKTALITVQREASLQEKHATKLIIKDDASMASAVMMLSEANKVADRVKEEKEKVTKPLLEALNAERARWKPIETICANVVTTIKTKMMDYQKKVDAERKEKEAKIAARLESGTIRIDTALQKISELPDSTQSVLTTSGAIQWITIKKLFIEDANVIPREYLDINEARVRDALKSGKVVPGAKFTEERIPKNLR